MAWTRGVEVWVELEHPGQGAEAGEGKSLGGVCSVRGWDQGAFRVDFAIGGAKHFMARDEIAQGCDEGIRVAGSGDTRCERDVVDRSRTVDAVLEPLP